MPLPAMSLKDWAAPVVLMRTEAPPLRLIVEPRPSTLALPLIDRAKGEGAWVVARVSKLMNRARAKLPFWMLTPSDDDVPMVALMLPAPARKVVLSCVRVN